MKNYCKKCGKRDTCIKLCKEAEEYVNQDFITVDEGLIYRDIENKEKEYEIEFEYCGFDKEYELKRNKALYRTAVINLYKDGKSTREIAYHVPYSQSQIVRIIQKYKKSDAF
ncbi:MAG: helix-turn-helix domain containing protein [Nanoarchaeota archaeon]|nr:helix-turn-helix domain containing protein [Nanoarchaeota archaeon]